jgi:hypothetical protein
VEWQVEFHDDFESEFDALPQEVKNELLATAQVLEMFGPQAKRPHVDTLKGSKYGNMKELRFSAFGGVWRVAFAFDPLRQAILVNSAHNSTFLLAIASMIFCSTGVI